VVAGAVFAPTGDGEVLPAAVTAPALVIITWYLPLESTALPARRVGACENAYGRLRNAGSRMALGELGCMRIERRCLGIRSWSNSMVAWNKGPTRIFSASGGPEQMGQGQEAHALVMAMKDRTTTLDCPRGRRDGV